MAKLGQHFMRDESILEKIVDYANITEDDAVLEVGAGYGSLTHHLAQTGCIIQSFEKDLELFRHLEHEKFPENVRLLFGDALKIRWPAFNKMVANIPYALSRKLTLKLLEHDFEQAVILVQKEYADKLTAKAGQDNYRMISVLAQTCCKIELLDVVPPNAFKPQPTVDSQIIRLTQNERLGGGYKEFVTKLFNQKNKKVKNIIDESGKYGGSKPRQLSPKDVHDLFTSHGEIRVG